LAPELVPRRIKGVKAKARRGVGYEVREAVNVEQAEGILRSRADVGLVFCDVKLPGERSGFDLREVIRQDFPQVKVLFASGIIKAEEAARASRTSCLKYSAA
jgi:DNA-binding NtrC family response regulator